MKHLIALLFVFSLCDAVLPEQFNAKAYGQIVVDTIYVREDGTTIYWPQLFRNDNHKFSPQSLGSGAVGAGKILLGNRTWADLPIGLPSQSGNAGKILRTNGTSASWVEEPYVNTAAVSGGAGNAVFYLTNDKTSTGTALYTSVTDVVPFINDSGANYTYSWSYNAGTKALTVNVKTNGTTVISLITVLTAPINVANGTSVRVQVKGNQ